MCPVKCSQLTRTNKWLSEPRQEWWEAGEWRGGGARRLAGKDPCLKGGSQEELPHVHGQGQWLRVPDCDGTGTAERS